MLEKRTINRLLSLPVVLMLLSACDKTPDVEHFSHCVESYYTISSILVETEKVEVNGRAYHKLVIGAEKGEYITDEQGELFEKLSATHKDYGGAHSSIAACVDCFYPDKDIRTIEVTAADGWDDVHPAGSSVNDLCHYVTNTLYPFIRNRYELVYYDGVTSDFYFHTIPYIHVTNSYPVDKPLSEITEEDTILIGGGISRQLFALFIPVADSDVARTLKVKLTDIDGKEFSADVTL